MKKTTAINVQGVAIGIVETNKESYISLTDMVKNFGDDAMIYSWMRNRFSLQFIGLWEQLHNPNFKGNEFETFKKEAGLNTFNLTPRKWIEATNAIGIISKAGRYGGGTYAHKDKDQNLDKKGNMRDYANIEQLIILANLESINAEFIKMGIDQSKRLQILNQTAISQMKSLIQNQNTIVGLENK